METIESSRQSAVNDEEVEEQNIRTEPAALLQRQQVQEGLDAEDGSSMLLDVLKTSGNGSELLPGTNSSPQ